MKIITISRFEVKPYTNNPRKNARAIEVLAKMIKEYGYLVPIVLDKNNILVAGHTRLEAIAKVRSEVGQFLEMKSNKGEVIEKIDLDNIQAVLADTLTDAQIKAFRLADNRVAEISTWDSEKLRDELLSLRTLDFDLSLTAFTKRELYNKQLTPKEKVALMAKDILFIPAFSIFDGRSGIWQERTRKWREILTKDLQGESREKVLASEEGIYGSEGDVSLFNPTLAEVLVRAFTKEGDKVIVPFGELTKVAIPGLYNRDVTGIELRKEQVDLNNKITGQLGLTNVNTIEGDALNENLYPEADFIYSCPPYLDLEKYSELKEDLSNQSEAEFFTSMQKFIQICYKKLKNDCFFVLIFGNIRRPDGSIVDITSKVSELATKEGFKLYNDIVYLQPLGTSSMRSSQFVKTRKVVRNHEKVLIFKKGEETGAIKVTKELDLTNQDILVFYKGDTKQTNKKAKELNKKLTYFELEDYLV